MVQELAVLLTVACFVDFNRKDFQVASYDLVVIRLGERRGKTIHYVQQEETFAKFLFLQQPKPKNRFSAVFSPNHS